MFGFSIIKTNKLEAKDMFIEVMDKLSRKLRVENELLKFKCEIQDKVIDSLQEKLEAAIERDSKTSKYVKKQTK